MQSIEGNGVVIFVFIRQGESIFPVQLHEDRLQHNSSMGVVIRFLDILSSSYLYQLLPEFEVMPLLFEQILKGS